MNKYLYLFLLPLFLVSSCLTNVNDKKAVQDYLRSRRFQYIQNNINMTSFMVFDKNTVVLSVYIDGKEKASRSYDYEIGNMAGSSRVINIHDNEGTWTFNGDGDLALHNKGELFVYTHIGDKRTVSE